MLFEEFSVKIEPVRATCTSAGLFKPSVPYRECVCDVIIVGCRTSGLHNCTEQAVCLGDLVVICVAYGFYTLSGSTVSLLTYDWFPIVCIVRYSMPQKLEMSKSSVYAGTLT